MNKRTAQRIVLHGRAYVVYKLLCAKLRKEILDELLRASSNPPDRSVSFTRRTNGRGKRLEALYTCPATHRKICKCQLGSQRV